MPSSLTEIKEATRALDPLDDREQDALLKAFAKHQPVLNAYLASLSEDPELAESMDVLFMLSILSWYLFRGESDETPVVEEGIRRSEDHVFARIDHFAVLSRAEQEREMLLTLENEPQPGLLAFGLETLSDEGHALTSSEQDLAFAYFWVLVDSLARR